MCYGARVPSTHDRRPFWRALLGLEGFESTERDAREHLARRTSLYFCVLLVLYLVRYASVSLLGLIRHNLWASLSHPSRIVHLVAIALAAVAWRIAARRTGTVAQSSAFEVLGTVTIGCAHAGSLALVAGNQLAVDLSLVLVYTQTLVARAAIVPSTTKRTVLVGAVNLLMICVGAYVAGRRSAATSGLPAWFWVFRVIEWGGISLLMTAIITQVIYGLRRRNRELAHLGQYTLEEKIGEGGMGIVYRARHGLLRRPTAIKLLPPERAGAVAIQRFEREVQLTATLMHPNTVAIYDFGRTPEGEFYCAMELLDGIDLDRLVGRDGPQPAARVVHILKQVCAALGEAHGRGLIHRDIKPANVVLCEYGGIADFAKVVDFGLVKDLGLDGDGVNTGSQTFLGTPLYLAPEAVRGNDQLDERSDIYSVGCVGYFLLTGKPVFDAGTLIEVCAHHLHTAPLRPSQRVPGVDVPVELERVLLACLAKQPSDRPANAGRLGELLGALGGVPSWTAAQAGAWWRERGLAVRNARPLADTTSVGTTVAVERRPSRT